MSAQEQKKSQVTEIGLVTKKTALGVYECTSLETRVFTARAPPPIPQAAAQPMKIMFILVKNDWEDKLKISIPKTMHKEQRGNLGHGLGSWGCTMKYLLVR